MRVPAKVAAVLLQIAAVAAGADFLVNTDTLSYARREHRSSSLADGRVLVTGGMGYNGNTDRCEIYDPATSQWTSTGSLTDSRRNHSLTLLPDGRALAVGGFDDYGWIPRTEIYNPATGMWSQAQSPSNTRSSHTATLLGNGKVLIAGGYRTSDGTGTTYPTRVEVFDPASGTWASTKDLSPARAFHTATLLPSGKVLIAGGMNGSGYLSSCRLYDPVTSSWSTTGSLATGRALHTTTLLPNGKVLTTGGFNGSYLSSTEIYDPATGSWSGSGSMKSVRRNHTASLLPDGRVLIAGGSLSASAYADGAEFYDPANGTCSPGPFLLAAREMHTATLLPAGEVLLAGGSNAAFLYSAELYDTPTLTTPGPSSITGTSARLGASVSKAGSAPVTARGFVFAPMSVNADPKLGGSGVISLSVPETTASFGVNLSGLEPGTSYSFRAYATNAVGTGYGSLRSFVTLTGLEEWRKTWYGVTTGTGDAADDASPHGTGLSNLLVYAFLGPNQNPALARPSQLPQVARLDGHFGFSFSPPPAVSGLIYGAEQSSSMEEGSWTDVQDSGSDGTKRFVVPATSQPKLFLRLKVAKP